MDRSGGVLKYANLLPKDKKGSIIWKHSDEYYTTFFEYLAYLLNFQISVQDLNNFGISEDGKIWGKIQVSPRKFSIEESKINKKEFQTLIYDYLSCLNYELPGKF